MTRDAYDDPLNHQYERWLFPEPVRMLELPVFEGAKISRCLYWPSVHPSDGLEVLVAGCGTREAALMAYHNPEASITGIDISKASLKHEGLLKEEYKLGNLELHHLAVEDAEQLERDFDLISCHGVLHHLADPEEGIRTLGRMLRRDGVLSLMLYGRYGRSGVSMLHELFKMIDLNQEPVDLDVVRATLAILGQFHPARNYTSAYRITHDSTLVDTFLNAREQNYSVQDCLDMVAGAGLAFQGWTNNESYYPEGRIPRGHPLREKLSHLSELDRWKAMELLNAVNQHYFMACRTDRSRDEYHINFNRNDVFSFVPHVQELRLRKLGMGFLESLTSIETAIFRRFDGEKTLHECIEALGFQGDISRLEITARQLMVLLWRRGLIQIGMPVLPQTTSHSVKP